MKTIPNPYFLLIATLVPPPSGLSPPLLLFFYIPRFPRPPTASPPFSLSLSRLFNSSALSLLSSTSSKILLGIRLRRKRKQKLQRVKEETKRLQRRRPDPVRWMIQGPLFMALSVLLCLARKPSSLKTKGRRM